MMYIAIMKALFHWTVTLENIKIVIESAPVETGADLNMNMANEEGMVDT